MYPERDEGNEEMELGVLKTKVKVGKPVAIGTLSVFPLLSTSVDGPPYLTGPEAFEAGLIKVSELDPPQVPSLNVHNLADVPILLVEGETLVGGSQNRTMNVTVLCPAKSSIVVPVSCVEAGRWGAEQPMKRSQRHSPAKLRATKIHSLRLSATEPRSRRTDQGRVWDEVQEQSMRHEVGSATSALEDVQEAVELRTAESLGVLEPMADQVGVAYAVGRTVVGFDLFDRPSTLARYLKGLVAGVALDAPDGPAVRGTKVSVERFLAEVGATDHDEAPGVGLGEEVLLSGEVVGTGLSFEDILVHLAAFPLPA